MEKPVYGIGIAHPPTNKDDSYVGYDLRKHELKPASKSIVDRNMYYRHRHHLGPIGLIDSSEITPGGALKISFMITNKNAIARQAIREMKSGFLTGLSIGQVRNPDAKEIGECTYIDLREVSLVPEPGREGSNIEKFSDGQNLYIFDSLKVNDVNSEEDIPQFQKFKKDWEFFEKNLSSELIDNNNQLEKREKMTDEGQSRVDTDSPLNKTQEEIKGDALPADVVAKLALLDRFEQVSKKARMDLTDMCAGLETDVEENARLEEEKAKKFAEKFQKIATEIAPRCKLTAEEVMGMEQGIQMVLAELDGSYRREEAAIQQKHKSTLDTLKNIETENAQLKKSVEQLQQKLSIQTKLPTSRLLNGLTGTSAAAAVPGPVQQAQKASVAPNYPPPNMMVNAEGQQFQRTSGLVPKVEPVGTFAAGYAPVSKPEHSFKNFLGKAKTQPLNKWTPGAKKVAAE